MYWASGLHLFAPLPFLPGKGGFGELFRTHLFCNLGTICNLEKEQGDASIVDKLTENVRVAYGIGLAIRLGQMARFEINYCIPHQFDDADELNRGVQFGIGVQFI